MDPVDMEWQEVLYFLYRKQTESDLSKIKLASTAEDKINLCFQNITLRDFVNEWVHKKVSKNTFSKNSNESIRIRTDGNKIFSGSRPENALLLYSKALCLAPPGSQEMSLAYGNRSAVLYHLKKYKECVADIDRASIEEKSVQKIRLQVRKGNALLHLKQHIAANEVFREAVDILKNLPENQQSTSQVIKFQNEIEKGLKLSSINRRKTILFDPDEEKSVPVPAQGYNPNFSSASNLIKLEETEKKGRHVIAKDNIKMGDILFVEKPVAFVLLPEFAPFYCHNCCLKICCPLPCRSCSEAVYCSSECQESSWSKYHKYECRGTVILYSIGIAHLALRLALLGHFCPDQRYQEAYNLVSHLPSMTLADTFFYTLTAFALNLYLNDTLEKKNAISIGGRILLHISQLVCNGHAITELRTRPNSSDPLTLLESEEECRIATAIYPSASMMNHSCDHNITNCFLGQHLIVKATRGIEQGQEVYNCYGVDWKRMSREARQNILETQYMFVCDCSACSAEVEPGVRFSATKCSLCGGAVVGLKCIDCLRENPVTTEALEALSSANDQLKLGESILQTNPRKALDCFEKTVSYYRKYLYKQNKLIPETLDKLAQCHILIGNIVKAFEVIENNLSDVSLRFGENSIELANELAKLCNIIVMILEDKDPDSLAQYKEVLLKGLKYVKKAIFLFNLYYGSWSSKFKDMKNHEEILFEVSSKMLSY